MSVDIVVPLIFSVLLLSIAASWVAGVMFVGRLREHHSELWTQLGSPGFFRQGRAKFNMLQFTRSNEFRELADDRLQLLGRIYAALFGFVLLVLIGGAVFMVYSRLS